jgi:ABC-type Mn2+/Zn2+ transport system ATPase subunit
MRTAVKPETATGQAGQSAAVRLRDVTVGYGTTAILRGANLTVGWGQMVGVIGPNGAGKSTLMKTILGTLRPWGGEVMVAGAPGGSRAARLAMGYVPQREVVNWDFPVTVSDVVMMGRTPRLGLFGFPGAADRQVVAESLAEVGMSAFAARQISELSGGQQQRVFLARALAQGGSVLLLDEPLNGVDLTTQEDIGKLLRRHIGDGCTVLLATHDLELAAEWCTQIVLVNHAICAAGPPAEVLRPETLRTAYGGHVLIVPEIEATAGQTMIPDDHGHPGGRPPAGLGAGSGGEKAQ